MDKKMLALVVCTAFISLSAVVVTATARMPNTPLYTFRMEQQSSEMNFLPREMNKFSYTAELGCSLDYEVRECCGAEPLLPPQSGIDTCSPQETCERTCPISCFGTCPWTCDQYLLTCNTCYNC